MRQLINAAINGVGFALIYWAIGSLFNWDWSYAGHHLTEHVAGVGILYALGSYQGWSDRERFGR